MQEFELAYQRHVSYLKQKRIEMRCTQDTKIYKDLIVFPRVPW